MFSYKTKTKSLFSYDLFCLSCRLHTGCVTQDNRIRVSRFHCIIQYETFTNNTVLQLNIVTQIIGSLCINISQSVTGYLNCNLISPLSNPWEMSIISTFILKLHHKPLVKQEQKLSFFIKRVTSLYWTKLNSTWNWIKAGDVKMLTHSQTEVALYSQK